MASGTADVVRRRGGGWPIQCFFAFDPSGARVSVFDLDRWKRYADIVLPGTPSATITGPRVGSRSTRRTGAPGGDRDSGIAVIDVRRLRVVA